MKDESIRIVLGEKFRITQMSARRALPIYTWLASLIGKTVGGAAGSIKNFKEITGIKAFLDSSNVDLGKLVAALGDSITTIHENPKIETYVDELLDCVLYGAQPLNLDNPLFQGKMKLLTMVVVESIKVNFPDFLEGSGGLGAILEKAKTSSQDTTSESLTSQRKTG